MNFTNALTRKVSDYSTIWFGTLVGVGKHNGHRLGIERYNESPTCSLWEVRCSCQQETSWRQFDQNNVIATDSSNELTDIATALMKFVEKKVEADHGTKD